MNCGIHHQLEDPQDVLAYFPFLSAGNRDSPVFHGFTVLVCIIGLLGNGAVLWFLFSSGKRNPFMFITNLSVADFGVLLALSTNMLLLFYVRARGEASNTIYILHLCLHNAYTCTHYASANFLMIISMDRCLAVLFPIWYRCHRSKSLLVRTSAILWALSSLMTGASFFFQFCYQNFLSNTVAFSMIYFLMVFSMAVLTFKVCCRSRLRQQGKLLVTILLSLGFFILTMAPCGLFFNLAQDKEMVSALFFFLKALNSSINPIIYFCISILKAGPSRKTLKTVFQKFFKEDEYVEEEGETSIHTFSSPFTTPYNTSMGESSIPGVGQ